MNVKIKQLIRKFIKVIKHLNPKNVIEYMRNGGITYLEINYVHSEKMLEGKNVIITGGTSGIGYEIAKEAIELGAKVLITGRDERKLERVKQELNCAVVKWDISKPELAKEKVEEIIKKMDGEIDCFINNAGVYKPLEYNICNIADWNKIIDTNLSGLYFATKEIVTQYFDKRREGNIIMIASIAGIQCLDGPYGTSKAGVIHVTKALAKKLLSKNIRVNAIAPGITASNINPIDEKGNIYMEKTKGKRMLSAKEIADVAMFLISDSSKCMTGQVMVCDNGETLL